MNWTIPFRVRLVRAWRKFKKLPRLLWPRLVRFPDQAELEPPKDEKEFQKRLLTAFERKPNSKLLSILNSGIFLWILSAVFLTVGGSYLTKRNECIANFKETASSLARLEAELRYRRWEIIKALDLDTLEAARAKISVIGSEQFEFKNLSIGELRSRRHLLYGNVSFGEDIPPSEQIDQIVERFQIVTTFMTGGLPFAVEYLFNKGDSSQITPQIYSRIQLFKDEFSRLIAGTPPLDLFPNCSPWAISKSLFDPYGLRSAYYQRDSLYPPYAGGQIDLTANPPKW